MLSINDLHVWLPRRGSVLTGAAFEVPAGIHALVGRNGAGASMLLRCIAGLLPTGARVHGTIRFQGRDLLSTIPDELNDVAYVTADAVAGAPDAALLLVDGTPARRESLLDALVARSARGCTVVWATHDLDGAWEVADSIIELVDGHTQAPQPPAAWEPRTLPEPTLLTLSRLLALPASRCSSPRKAAVAFRTSGLRIPLLPPASPPRAVSSARSVRIDPAALGLEGPELLLPLDQCAGIIDVDDEPLPAPRLAGFAQLPEQLPNAPAGKAARRLEKRFDVPKGQLLATASSHAPLRRRDTLDRHSPGERALLRTALLTTAHGPLWARNPQRDLDARAKATLAATLLRGSPAIRLLYCSDVEFLVRACTTIIVVQRRRILAVGAPTSLVAQLPRRPIIAEALNSTHYLRLTDLVSALYEQESA